MSQPYWVWIEAGVELRLRLSWGWGWIDAFVETVAISGIKERLKQGSKFDQRAMHEKRFLYRTIVQKYTHLSYTFCTTIPIIGAVAQPKNIFWSTHIAQNYLLQSSAPNFKSNFNLGLGLVLFLLNPATHPPNPHPTTPTHPTTQPPADRESMILTN